MALDVPGRRFARQLLLVLLVTRVLLTCVGMESRVEEGVWRNASGKPVAPNVRLVDKIPEVWVVWDSGYYLWIASIGYPDFDPPLSGTFQRLKPGLLRLLPHDWQAPVRVAPFDVSEHFSSYPKGPFYPLLIRITADVLAVWDRWAALIVSNGFLAVSAMLLYLLLRKERDDRTARFCALLYCLSPASPVMSSAYDESLLSALALTFFLGHLSGKVPVQLAAAALATVTHARGNVLLAWGLWAAAADLWGAVTLRRAAVTLGWSLLACMPVFFLFLWQYLLTGDPLLSLHAQAAWGRGFSVDFLQRQWNALKWEELARFNASIMGLVLVIGLLGWRARDRTAGRQLERLLYGYSLLLFSLDFLSGTPLSFWRHTVAMYGLLLAVADLLPGERVRRCILLGSFLLSAIAMWFWTRWSGLLV